VFTLNDRDQSFSVFFKQIVATFDSFLILWLMDFFSETPLLLAITPICIFAIALEIIISNYRGDSFYSVKGVLENIYLSLLNMGLDIFIRSTAFAVLTFFYFIRIADFENAFAYWVLLLLAEDFMYYWLHRFDHCCRFFWAIHATHHSSEEMNFTVGFRSSVFQPLYRFIYFIPLALVGFHPLDIFLIYSLTQLYGILVHTQLVGKLGFLEHVLVTPSHHRVHHACNEIYLDRNLGMTFIFWDKIFGTFTPETIKPAYGLKKQLPGHHPMEVIGNEWFEIAADLRKSKTWKQRFMYIFGPPGWSHDGSSKTTTQLRDALNAE
jgi:sterol desaturase/sphingolipid hydroxylase (fatty acid hydroxylase superfamily)